MSGNALRIFNQKNTSKLCFGVIHLKIMKKKSGGARPGAGRKKSGQKRWINIGVNPEIVDKLGGYAVVRKMAEEYIGSQ